MKCPSYTADMVITIDSRDCEAGVARRRRKECISCGKRFTTYERQEVESKAMRKKALAKKTRGIGTSSFVLTVS
jgi:transcriptional repressor NrdR